MKKYEEPEWEILLDEEWDIICASLGGDEDEGPIIMPNKMPEI